MSTQKFKKRLGFARTKTDDQLPRQHDDNIELGEPSAPIPTESLDMDSKDPVYQEVRDISESEANRKLSMFHANHRWDPNLSDDAFEVIDEATNSHDVKAEAQLVGEMIENSPYPEVAYHLHIFFATSLIICWFRFERSSATTMRKYP